MNDLRSQVDSQLRISKFKILRFLKSQESLGHFASICDQRRVHDLNWKNYWRSLRAIQSSMLALRIWSHGNWRNINSPICFLCSKTDKEFWFPLMMHWMRWAFFHFPRGPRSTSIARSTTTSSNHEIRELIYTMCSRPISKTKRRNTFSSVYQPKT